MKFNTLMHAGVCMNQQILPSHPLMDYVALCFQQYSRSEFVFTSTKRQLQYGIWNEHIWTVLSPNDGGCLVFAFFHMFFLFCFPRATLWLRSKLDGNHLFGAIAPTTHCWQFQVRCLPMRYWADANIPAKSRKSIKSFRNSAEISGTAFPISTGCVLFRIALRWYVRRMNVGFSFQTANTHTRRTSLLRKCEVKNATIRSKPNRWVLGVERYKVRCN